MIIPTKYLIMLEIVLVHCLAIFSTLGYFEQARRGSKIDKRSPGTKMGKSTV